MIIPLDGQWRDAYDGFIYSHSAGTFFHQRSWLETVRDVLRKSVFALVSVGHGNRINGVLPLVLCRTMSGKALVSVPFRDQGGPLVYDFWTLADLIGEAKELSVKLNASRITFQRMEGRYHEKLRSEGFMPQKRGIDSTLDLSISEDDHWWRLKSPVRRAVKKARKSGIDVTVDAEGKHLNKFFDLFLMTRRRLGVAAYPFRFFQRLFQVSGDGFKLLVARSAKGTVCGGLVVFCHGDNVYSGYIGYSPKYLPLRVVDILFYEAISWARRTGARWFLFGTDSIHQESLIRYKRKWLAETVEVCAWHWTQNGKPYQVPDTEGQHFRLIRAALRRAPRSLFLIASRLSLRYWE